MTREEYERLCIGDWVTTPISLTPRKIVEIGKYQVMVLKVNASRYPSRYTYLDKHSIQIFRKVNTMNRELAKATVANFKLIEAFANGAKVEMLRLNTCNDWVEVDEINVSTSKYHEYRIKKDEVAELKARVAELEKKIGKKK